MRQWIAEGAKYEAHWSLVPLPKQISIPVVKNATWSRTAIDRFVLARLEREGVRPSHEAGRADWLRRVTFDLTGLPPTPADAAFRADNSPRAFEKIVDRLLASPRYGERMAAPWLDVARYADSYGYQSDQLCRTWPYRDWVVKAFNDNLPYDKFLTWQWQETCCPVRDTPAAPCNGFAKPAAPDDERGRECCGGVADGGRCGPRPDVRHRRPRPDTGVRSLS